jgi:hypothetical protein
MLKPFEEALKDGFLNIKDIPDKEFRDFLREEGVAVDDVGIWQYIFGEHKEFELTVEPLEEENEYLIGLYRNKILLIPKLYICAQKKKL